MEYTANTEENVNKVSWFIKNAGSLALCLFAFLVNIAALAFFTLPLFGVETYSINTDLPLWQLWFGLSVLFWLGVAAIMSSLLGMVADDMTSDKFTFTKTTGRINRYLLKGVSFTLYPALLFWKAVISVTHRLFAKK